MRIKYRLTTTQYELLSVLSELGGTKFEAILRRLVHLWVRHIYLKHTFWSPWRGHPPGKLLKPIADAVTEVLETNGEIQAEFSSALEAASDLHAAFDAVEEALNTSFYHLIPIIEEEDKKHRRNFPTILARQIWPYIAETALGGLWFFLCDDARKDIPDNPWLDALEERGTFTIQRILYRHMREIAGLALSFDWSNATARSSQHVDLYIADSCDWILSTEAGMRIRFTDTLLDGLFALDLEDRERLIQMVDKYPLEDGQPRMKQIAVSLDDAHTKLVRSWTHLSETEFFLGSDRNQPLWAAKRVVFEMYPGPLETAIRNPIPKDLFFELRGDAITKLNDRKIEYQRSGHESDPSDYNDPKFN